MIIMKENCYSNSSTVIETSTKPVFTDKNVAQYLIIFHLYFENNIFLLIRAHNQGYIMDT